MFNPKTTLENLRIRVASVEALPQLSLLGLLTGLLAGAITVAFRLVVDIGQIILLPEHQVDDFESLSWIGRLLLPILGGLGIGLLQEIAHTYRTVGVVHVLERIAYYQGRLPWRNTLQQFVTAALSIICGHSVGREGPSVHLGAASGSLLGQWLELPNNALRTLVACGIAAAIAASFNTPLAGVIFSMEVIMMQYQLAGVAPIILAAVVGAAIAWAVFGPSPAFSVPPTEMQSLLDLPYLVLIGLAVGILAAAYNRLLHFFSGLGSSRPVWQRCTAAGLLVGLCGIAVPEIMGLGYDTVNTTLLGQLGLGTLIAITAAKLLATTACVGLGIPGGLIGPTLVIGTAAGGALGIIGTALLPQEASPPALYAMVGMAAMMSATLQAPLAALVALVELTADPHILFPGMLAVVVANLVARELLRQEALFLMLLRARGLDYHYAPTSLKLRQAGVASVMDRRFVELPVTIDRETAAQTLTKNPRWVLVKQAFRPISVMQGIDVARALNEETQDPLNLMEIPAAREDIQPVPFHATLQEALEILNTSHAKMLYVERRIGPTSVRIYGVLSRQEIESYYG
ncbi:Chloride channel core [Nitrosococcus halophilus Nc 4]|uniref:Chloride channel core n=1 Tax=Nitrosococcus halophilus (strain Nc4) TaxID=472759 RepID=D5BUR6_NITHN|nr:Chloride channel core [Nitrosococcus halophilus Nc 4]